MTQPHSDSPVERATAAMRASQADPRLVDITTSVMERVRRLSRPGRTLLAGPPGDDGPRTHVAERVVRDVLRRALTTSDLEPVAFELDIADDRLVGLRLDLAVRYGVVIDDAAEEARRVAALTLTAVLGADGWEGPIDIVCCDVLDDR